MALKFILLSILPILVAIASNPFVFTSEAAFHSPRPVIGILAVDSSHDIQKKYDWAESYISTFYVKFIQMGGARVVPIMINRPEAYYKKKFFSINGLLIPGGGIPLKDSKYAKAARILFQMAEEANGNGTYFPIWATCLGFEMLSYLLSNSNETLLVPCKAEDIAMPLLFTRDFRTSRLFYSMPDDVYFPLVAEKVTANYHKQCLTPDKVKSSNLEQKIHVLSTNIDEKGLSFVSTFESLTTPYYAVQFHPEKNPFEWSEILHNVPHSTKAVRVAQYFANFFVNEAGRNSHNFTSRDEENLAVIENYRESLYYLIDLNITMAERYLFNSTQT